MKPLFIATITLVIAANSLFAAGKLTDLSYNLQRKDSTSLLITVSFKGNKSGKTLLHLPKEGAGQQMLCKAVSMLHVVSKACFFNTTSQPGNYLVRYRPGSAVRVVYCLRQDCGGPLRKSAYPRLIVQKNIFYFD